MKKILGIVGLLCFINIAFGQINVVPITDTTLQLKNNAIVYFLPQKIISVKIDVETKRFVPGPYCKYAEKYLMIDDVPLSEYTQSNIIGVEFNDHSFADPNAGFFILKNKADLQFDKRGVLATYNGSKARKRLCLDENEYNYQNIPEFINDDEVVFSDFSVKRNFTGITDTTYKVIELDSAFQKIPVYNTVITSKDFEQKAEEAANYIIKIRKRRFKLQSGQFETEKPPKNVEFMVKELYELEQQYLELFIGKEMLVKNSFYAVYKPKTDKVDDKNVLFYLSDENGISTEATVDSEPVYLIAHNCGRTNQLEDFYSRQTELSEKEKTRGIYYRVPGHGAFSVEFDGHKYAREGFIIPQYGYLNNLPAKMFKNKHLKILFDVENGSIERIINE